jgi:hypothetical protein
MSDNPKTHEIKLLKEQFNALVHNEGLRQDSLEQFLDNAIRYRCGRFIAWAAETKTKANDGGQCLYFRGSVRRSYPQGRETS